MIETNKIKEIYTGHYQVILDFPIAQNLDKIIDRSYKYVWGVEHNEVRSEWSLCGGHTLFGIKQPEDFYARNIVMEFLIDTSAFIEIIPYIKQTVKIIQTNSIPPPFIDLSKLKGKTRYDLLRDKTDYLFEIEIPGAADYAPVVSSNQVYLESLLQKFKSQ